MYQIDTKFDRQMRPVTETSWVVSYGGKTIPRRRTAAILRIDISPYLSEKSSDFHEILYTAADFELGVLLTSRDQKWKSCIGQTPSSTERISWYDNPIIDQTAITAPSPLKSRRQPDVNVMDRLTDTADLYM